MNQYITGAIIKQLREKKNLTQAQLAEKLNVSDKTVSKWETAKGFPELSLWEPLAQALGTSVTELLSGMPITNGNVSANMRRSLFYVCPVCGNVIHSMGQAAISCHGVALVPEEAEKAEGGHTICVEVVEDEYYVNLDHEMEKTHFISFLAAVSSDRLQLVKLYPEGNAEARFQIADVKRFYAFCNRDGLFYVDLK